MDFVKYHGLGNDYIVIRQRALANLPLGAVAKALCDRHRGPGADGVLVDEGTNGTGERVVRIVNPDGSEAEKSGNGLRIFARFLWDTGEVGLAPFSIRTVGGVVLATVAPGGGHVTVDMGQAVFLTLHGLMTHDAESIEYHAVSMGNPHCVTFGEADAKRAQRLGPLIERDWRFPERTNVQFAHVVDRRNLTVEIWERGAGYTLASGSSACAVAAVARRLDRVDPAVDVRMPGGTLAVHVSEDYAVTMKGPVVKVVEGRVSPESLPCG